VALGILLVVISIAPATFAAIGVARLVERYDTALATWVTVHLMGLAIIGLVWRLGIYPYKAPLSALGLAVLGLPRVKTVLLTLGTLAASLLATVVYAQLVSLIGSKLLSPPDIPSDIVFPGPAVVFTFQALALVTPLTEEIFFRGFVFAGLVPWLGVGRAMVASAVVFSLFHLSVGVLIPVFMTGLLLAWLYHRTGSLWPSIVAHAGQNALAVAIEVYAA